MFSWHGLFTVYRDTIANSVLLAPTSHSLTHVVGAPTTAIMDNSTIIGEKDGPIAVIREERIPAMYWFRFSPISFTSFSAVRRKIIA